MEPTGLTKPLAVNWQPSASPSPMNDSLVYPSHLPDSPLLRCSHRRRPDIVILDETVLSGEPLWEQEPVITLGRSIKLVVESSAPTGKLITPEKLKSMLLGIRVLDCRLSRIRRHCLHW